jgi:hypothetical protein
MYKNRKQHIHITALWAAIGLFGSVALLQGGLVGSRSVLDLEQTADLIVVGSASADISVGATTTAFPLQVTRVIKGDSAIAGKSISVTWASPSGLLTSVAAPRGAHIGFSGTGLWFLQRSSNDWLLLPVMGGGISFDETYFPVPPGPIAIAYTYGSTTALSDKVASELAAAVEADHPASLSLDSLSRTLETLGSPVVQVLYLRMSASAKTQQRILGLSGLLRGGSASALTSAAAGASMFEGFPRENGILLESIRYNFRPTDANSITALGRAAVDSTNPSLSFREAAAHALASIHTVETLPHLATLLDDPDAKLRMEAIGGIGSFANGLQVQTTANTPSLASLQLPTSAPYKTADTVANFAQGAQAISRDEAAYLVFWKNWWTSNRASLGY